MLEEKKVLKITSRKTIRNFIGGMQKGNCKTYFMRGTTGSFNKVVEERE